jgi:hypothetical protein
VVLKWGIKNLIIIKFTNTQNENFCMNFVSICFENSGVEYANRFGIALTVSNIKLEAQWAEPVSLTLSFCFEET